MSPHLRKGNHSEGERKRKKERRRKGKEKGKEEKIARVPRDCDTRVNLKKVNP